MHLLDTQGLIKHVFNPIRLVHILKYWYFSWIIQVFFTPKMSGIFRGRIKNTSGTSTLNWLRPFGPDSIEIQCKWNGYLVTLDSPSAAFSVTWSCDFYTTLWWQLTALSSACEPWVYGGNLMASLSFFLFSARGGVCALPPLLLILVLLAPFSPCPQLKRSSKMQLASQKGQQTCGHRGCGSCHGRLSWGHPSCGVFWVSWQNEGCAVCADRWAQIRLKTRAAANIYYWRSINLSVTETINRIIALNGPYLAVKF